MGDDNRGWAIRWHITADGTVIRQRSRGEAEHQQLYGEHPTNRRVELDDLVRIDERVAHFGTFWGRVTTALLWALVLFGVGFVVGIVLIWSGRSDTAVPLVVVTGVALVLLFVAGGFATHRVRIGVPRIYADAGVDPAGVTMSARDARERIGAIGTLSSEPRTVERA